MQLAVATKECIRCGADLPLADYFSNGKGGKQAHCKKCQLVANNKSRQKRYRRDPLWRSREAAALEAKYPGKSAARIKAYKAANPVKTAARMAVCNAVIAGKLFRPITCEMRGPDCEGRIEGHHDSYERDRWLTVTWLCRRCHNWIHKGEKNDQERRQGKARSDWVRGDRNRRHQLPQRL